MHENLLKEILKKQDDILINQKRIDEKQDRLDEKQDRQDEKIYHLISKVEEGRIDKRRLNKNTEDIDEIKDKQTSMQIVIESEKRARKALSVIFTVIFLPVVTLVLKALKIV